MRLYTDGVFSAEEDINIGNLDVGRSWYFTRASTAGYSYTGAIAEVQFLVRRLDDATILDWHCGLLTEAHPAWEALQGRWQLTEEPAGHRLCSKRRALRVADGTLWQVPESLVISRLQQHPRMWTWP